MRFDLGPDLTAAREAALAEVDACAAGRVAALGGNTTAHALKRAEAERAIEEGSGFATLYPVLAAEAMATNQSIQEVARVVMERTDAWRASLAKIEARRIATKAQIRAASSHAAIREIVAAHKEPPA